MAIDSWAAPAAPAAHLAFARGVSSHRLVPLERWELLELSPGQLEPSPPAPGQLAPAVPPSLPALPAEGWIPAQVPGTAAAALLAARRLGFEQLRDLDAREFWFRCRFAAPQPLPGARRVLRLDGLATLCDAWLNGAHLLSSESMFLAHEREVTALLHPDGAPNELLLRFSSLSAELARKRPRPRWKTRLVAQQQLRFLRTTLLGRIPGWSPKLAPVGPYRPVRLEDRGLLELEQLSLRPRVEGDAGVLEVALLLRPPGNSPAGAAASGDAGANPPGLTVHSAELVVGEAHAPLEALQQPDGSVALHGTARLPGVRLWWPHTHGEPALYPVRVLLRTAAGEVELDLGRTGFRTVQLDSAGGRFELRVNGQPIFCRGACWTPADLATLGAAADIERTVRQARDAGMNMLRVGGTMVYEQDAFHDACDALGVLVFQDFMFANLDYPVGDAAFLSAVRAEAAQLLSRTQASPSLALLCGGSEVEQQAAMFGLPRESWSSALFQEVLPAACARLRPDVPYWPNSPSGGPLPFQIDQGLSHYYGVGAYLRPLTDARRAEVRFTSECLAFANVPAQATLDAFLGDGQAAVHHPRWKERVPRDSGAGWDFDDVRDHYLRELYRVDPIQLRSSDPERYLQLSRVVTGEVMFRTFAEWRRARSSCKGGLVWFLRDLWPGAGWGVIDALSRPKAAFWYLRRAFQPRALFFADEGLNGLRLHALNESAAPLEAEVRLTLFRDGQRQVAEGAQRLTIPARGEAALEASNLLGGFLDTTWAYRFGPCPYDVARAALRDTRDGSLLAEDFHFPLGLPSLRTSAPGLQARAVELDRGRGLELHAVGFAQSVELDLGELVPSDNHFHLAPGATRTVRVTGAGPLRGLATALNSDQPVRISEGAAA